MYCRWIVHILFGCHLFWLVALRSFVCDAGVGTKIDPTLCRADRMVGQVLGTIDALPDIFTELEISYFLLRRLLGVRTEGDKKAAKVIEILALVCLDADLDCGCTFNTYVLYPFLHVLIDLIIYLILS